MNNNLNIIWKQSADLGESPMWHPKENKLYWLDILKKQINCLDIETQAHDYAEFSGILGTVVPRYSSGIVATIDNQIIAFDFVGQKKQFLAQVFPETSSWLRMNDGKCDYMGRLWLGVASTDSGKCGGLYRFDPDASLHLMDGNILFANGMTWNRENNQFYFVDTARYCIYQYDFDMKTGDIDNRRIFFQLEKNNIKPDGLTIDQEGILWLALYNGGQFLGIDSSGKITQTIELPVSRPTSGVFAGKNHQQFIMTTCAFDFNDSKRLDYPAGVIYSLSRSIGGFDSYCFSG